MTQQDKQLLLRDLCARLPYEVIMKTCHPFLKEKLKYFMDVSRQIELGWLPYLRPMSSMTAEEREEYQKFLFPCPDYDGRVVVGVYHKDLYKLYDWLNAHHFDYRGLIEKGLAIEVTEENNPYKQ